MQIVHLGSYHDSPDQRVFIGRCYGEEVRLKAGMDRWKGKVVVTVPADTVAVASSFWIGLLGPSVRAGQNVTLVGDAHQVTWDDAVREIKTSEKLERKEEYEIRDIDERHWLSESVFHRREKHNWTQEYLADRADLDLKTLQNIEAGRYGPTHQELVRLSLALDCYISDLYAGV